LKRTLDELYVAMSLGERDGILARLRQIVPQFSYAGSDQDHAGSTETVPLSASAHAAEATPTLPDVPVRPNQTWQVSPHVKPLLGSAGGVPGD
jgi:hypothetical protein